MTRYAVDSDILITIEKSGGAGSIKPPVGGLVVITDSVWDELTIRAQQSGASQAMLNATTALLARLAGAPTRIEVQTDEARTFARLRQPPIPPTEGEGEHSVIAYAAHHQDVVGVFLDRRALHRAVEELRGRVLSLHGFLQVLRDAGLMAGDDAKAISKYLRKSQAHLREPLWWR